MRNDYFDDMIKNALKRTADEIQENPYEKNKVMSLIKERESFKMRNKHFPKKAIIVIAAIVCLSATTALAAGGQIAGWVSHVTLNEPTYASVEEVQNANEDFGFQPYLVDEFANGYAFTTAYMTKFDALDADNNKIGVMKEMDATYKNADGEKVYLTESVKPADLVPGDDITAYDGETTYNDITIKYDVTPYKCVSTDYEITEEEQAKIDAGEMQISVDSDKHHEPEYYDVFAATWTIDGVDYMIFGFDYDSSLTESELYEMAEEIIDLQLAQ